MDRPSPLGLLGAGRILAGLAVGFALIVGCFGALGIGLLGPRGASSTAEPAAPQLLPSVDATGVAAFAGGAVPVPAGTGIHTAPDVRVAAPGVVIAGLEHTRAGLPHGALVRVLPTRHVAARHTAPPVPGRPSLRLVTVTRAKARRGGSSPGDVTPPSIVCQTIAPGWHADNVAVRCSAEDSGSGLADDADVAFTLVTAVAAGDEEVKAATGGRTICDVAGNCAVASAVALSIDRRRPTISCDAPDRSWQPANESVGCTATDGGSGLDDSGDRSFGLRTTVADGAADGAADTNSHRVCDAAGNCATAGPVSNLRIDRRPPQLRLAQSPNGAHGWFDTAPAALTATGTDDHLDHVTCVADGDTAARRTAGDPESAVVSLTADGAHDVTCTAVDLAGNTTSDTATLRLDTAAPSISLDTDRQTYGVDDTVTVACSADDALSGIDSRDCPSHSISAADLALGAHRLTATATDVAGNQATASASFDVTVSVASLTSLTKRLVSDSQADAALVSDLAAVDAAPDGVTKASAVAAYQGDVRALPASAVSADDAATLIRFADGL